MPDSRPLDEHPAGTGARLALAALGWIGALFLRLLASTWRVEWQGTDPLAARTEREPLALVIWHAGLLVAAACFRARGIAVAVSLSRDGDRIDAVLTRLRFAPSVRGSSSRGATGLLRELIRRTRAGQPVAILLDGPRGPAGVAKPGVLALARATGAAIVPVGIGAAPGRRFGSWDRTLLPLPFARVRIVYGPPLFVPRDAGPEALEELRSRLEETLDGLDARAREER